MASVVEPLRSIDWEDTDAMEEACRKVLEHLNSNRRIIRQALNELPDRPELLALCEHPDSEATAELGQQLDKIVLYEDETGFRVRMHIFWSGCEDLPHNHRWSLCSMILKGQFRHSLYGVENYDDTMQLPIPKPLQVRIEQVGSIYALHHTVLHALVAEENAVSLFVRGPSVKERGYLVDPKTGRRIWHLGAAEETPEAKALKQMTPERLRGLTAKLDEWNLLD
jgi:predicted metal-dependent enzyme (double-stranded beta helix superfamily)